MAASGLRMTGSLLYLVPLALMFGAVALGAFLWSLKSGQYEDLEGAAQRILIDAESDRIDGDPEPSSGEATEPREKRGQSILQPDGNIWRRNCL